MYQRTCQLFGAILAVIALILLLVSLSTTEWLNIQLNRDSMGSLAPRDKLAYFSRSRGLFRECWKDDSLSTVISKSPSFLSGLCLRVDYNVLNTEWSKDVQFTKQYTTRAGLMVTMIVMFVASLLCTLVGFVLYCYTVATERSNAVWSLNSKWVGVMLFISAFLNALGMAFYHGAEYIETVQVTEWSTPSAYDEFFTQTQSAMLQKNTVRSYSWSYALGWLAVGCEIFAAMLFFFVSCCRPEEAQDEKQVYDSHTISSGLGARNKAYEYVEDGAATLPGNEGADYYSRGRSFNPYSKGSLKHEFNPQYNFEQGWTITK